MLYESLTIIAILLSFNLVLQILLPKKTYQHTKLNFYVLTIVCLIILINLISIFSLYILNLMINGK